MNNQEKELIQSLELAIFYLNSAIDTERRLNHQKHRHQGYAEILDRLQSFLECEKALAKRKEIIGR